MNPLVKKLHPVALVDPYRTYYWFHTAGGRIFVLIIHRYHPGVGYRFCTYK